MMRLKAPSSGSMPFSVEIDITGTDGLVGHLGARPTEAGWVVNA